MWGCIPSADTSQCLLDWPAEPGAFHPETNSPASAADSAPCWPPVPSSRRLRNGQAAQFLPVSPPAPQSVKWQVLHTFLPSVPLHSRPVSPHCSSPASGDVDFEPSSAIPQATCCLQTSSANACSGKARPSASFPYTCAHTQTLQQTHRHRNGLTDTHTTLSRTFSHTLACTRAHAHTPSTEARAGLPSRTGAADASLRGRCWGGQVGSAPGCQQARELHGGRDGHALPPCLSLSLSDSPTHLAQCKAHSRFFTGRFSNERPCAALAETYTRTHSDCPSATRIFESASLIPPAHSPKTKKKGSGGSMPMSLTACRGCGPPDSEPGSTAPLSWKTRLPRREHSSFLAPPDPQLLAAA